MISLQMFIPLVIKLSPMLKNKSRHMCVGLLLVAARIFPRCPGKETWSDNRTNGWFATSSGTFPMCPGALNYEAFLQWVKVYLILKHFDSQHYYIQVRLVPHKCPARQLPHKVHLATQIQGPFHLAVQRKVCSKLLARKANNGASVHWLVRMFLYCG